MFCRPAVSGFNKWIIGEHAGLALKKAVVTLFRIRVKTAGFLVESFSVNKLIV